MNSSPDRTRTMFTDVQDFHKKFGLDKTKPRLPSLFKDPEHARFRRNFMQEELEEYDEAMAAGDEGRALDALVDLVYVALGTADLMNMPFDAAWFLVHSANMKKVRAERASDSKRGSTFDVIKPPGWEAPDIQDIINKYRAHLSTMPDLGSASNDC